MLLLPNLPLALGQQAAVVESEEEERRAHVEQCASTLEATSHDAHDNAPTLKRQTDDETWGEILE